MRCKPAVSETGLSERSCRPFVYSPDRDQLQLPGRLLGSPDWLVRLRVMDDLKSTASLGAAGYGAAYTFLGAILLGIWAASNPRSGRFYRWRRRRVLRG